MEPTPIPASLRTLLTVAAAVLALVGIVGVATGAGDESDDVSTASGDSTTTTASGVTDSTLGGSDTTLAGGPTTTAPAAGGGGGTVTTRPSGGSGTTVPAVTSDACTGGTAGGSPSGSISPPAVGNYSYVSCDDATVGQDDAVRDGGSTPDRVRRKLTRSQDGGSITETRAYGSSGVVEEAFELASPFGNISCDLDPDVLLIPAGLTVGKQWSGEGSCTTQQAGKITVKGTGKVTGSRTVKVGGVAIDAWVIEAQVQVQAVGQTQRSDSVVYLDPTRGIDLYRRVTLIGRNGQQTTATLRLASLTPKAG